jgi:phosphohistidine phosphatase
LLATQEFSARPILDKLLMKIFLLRHAHAEPGEIDSARPLSSKGNKQMKGLSSKYIERILDEVLLVEHSPYLRATQTAQWLKKYRKGLTLKKLSGILPDDNYRRTALMLAKTTKPRFLVGHNPHLTGLVGLLLGLRAGEEGVRFRKAGLMALERLTLPTDGHPYGRWRLLWYIIPD